MTLRAILIALAAAGMAVLLFLPADLRAAEPIDLGAIGSACIESRLQDCKVLTAGYLNVAEYGDDDGAPLIAWQTQLGIDEYEGIMGGFVLFQHGSDGWSLLDSGFDGFFQPPRLNEDRVLHMPGFGPGTGAYNTDRLYQWGDLGHAVYREGWIAIEMEQWLADIAQALPGDLRIWKGVDYDFSNPWAGYVARTALWHENDGNCCPTGGSTVIALEIRNESLVATGQTYAPPAKAK